MQFPNWLTDGFKIWIDALILHSIRTELRTDLRTDLRSYLRLKWLVANFATYTCGTIWWPKFNLKYKWSTKLETAITSEKFQLWCFGCGNVFNSTGKPWEGSKKSISIVWDPAPDGVDPLIYFWATSKRKVVSTLGEFLSESSHWEKLKMFEHFWQGANFHSPGNNEWRLILSPEPQKSEHN